LKKLKPAKTKNMKAKVLIIAGSDSGGGAGIQGDIKSASACGAYAATAITSITVQNTLGVSNVFDLPIEIVQQQIEAVLSDIGADVIKTGMLSTAEIIIAIVETLKNYPQIKLVVDPVMVAKGGAKLLQNSALEALKTKLLPTAYLVTPNIPEAEILSGLKISNEVEMIETAKIILQQTGAKNIILKGGHLENENLVDILLEGSTGKITKIASKKISTKNTHGTGCSFASSISAFLAQDLSLECAFKNAHEYIYNAIKNAPDIGHGHGPIEHFWKL
jgi:hydroxymethylpyrimidine kinase/phosphomethylpyrimidine kinase